MRAPYSHFRAVLAGALLAGAALVSAGCAAEEEQTLVVLGPWTDGEEDPFEATLRELSKQTGRHYVYEGTRSLRETLVAQLRADAPPDVAILNAPGDLAEYALDGDAQPLPPDVQSKAIGPWAPPITVTDSDGNTDKNAYWVPVRVDLKSIVWSKAGEEAAGDDEAVWCLGMASGPTSGWPGTDWIEDLLLQRHGYEVYEKWATGKQPWDKGPVKEAWQDWATVLATDDADTRPDPLTKHFENLGAKTYGLLNGKDCTREHQGSFIRRHYGPDVKPAPTSDFVEGLSADRKMFEVSGDMAAVFKPSPAAWDLLLKLASPRAQADWIAAADPQERPFFPSDAAGTARRGVSAPTGSSAAVLGLFSGADQICLDASDAMPPTLRGAFQRAVLEFLQKPQDTAELDGLLGQLEKERQLQRNAKAFVLDDLCEEPPG
ncbi:extracellular solute-binding protein [Streptomyces sp. NPDC050433]|uniref:extracellular solute-binding protein n=1 Tax=Streptomyces sp. NPDC050433 TaxID=3365615 RepID=UPI00379ED40D